MNITFVVTRDREYLRRMVRDVARAYVWFGVLYLVGSLLVSVLCFMSGDGVAVLAGLVALSLLGIAWYAFVVPWRARWPLPGYLEEPTTFTLTDEGLTTDSATVSVRLNWTAVTRAVKRPYAFLIFIHSQNYRDVPRSGLTATQEEELQAFLANRHLLRPAARPSRPAPVTADE